MQLNVTSSNRTDDITVICFDFYFTYTSPRISVKEDVGSHTALEPKRAPSLYLVCSCKVFKVLQILHDVEINLAPLRQYYLYTYQTKLI